VTENYKLSKVGSVSECFMNIWREYDVQHSQMSSLLVTLGKIVFTSIPHHRIHYMGALLSNMAIILSAMYWKSLISVYI